MDVEVEVEVEVDVDVVVEVVQEEDVQLEKTRMSTVSSDRERKYNRQL